MGLGSFLSTAVARGKQAARNPSRIGPNPNSSNRQPNNSRHPALRSYLPNAVLVVVFS